MPYPIPNFEQIRADYLRDVKNLDDTAHTQNDSDNFIRASATASAADGLYHHQLWIARQILPDTADPENIERHAALRGLVRKPATCADGFLTLTPSGEVSAFPAGLVARHDETESEFITTAAWQGGDTSQGIVLPCVALVAGSAPEYAAEPVTLQTSPFGILSQCTLQLRGGTEEETHAELLARLLFYMRNPPGGGMASDYERWALEVPGVSWARCIPQRRGLGSVDVVIVSDGGLPSPETLEATQANIDNKRPVACPDCKVLAPAPLVVDVTANVRTIAGVTLATLNPRVDTALAQYFSQLLPGDVAVVAKIAAAILEVQDVADVQLTQPAANTIAEHLRWPRFGTLTLAPL